MQDRLSNDHTTGGLVQAEYIVDTTDVGADTVVVWARGDTTGVWNL